jgi:hypothetical protein
MQEGMQIFFDAVIAEINAKERLMLRSGPAGWDQRVRRADRWGGRSVDLIAPST